MQVTVVASDDAELAALAAAQQAELSVRYGENPDHGFAQPALHEQTGWLLLRDDDGTPLGCAALQPLSHTVAGAAPDLGEVKRLYVVPGARGRGLSRVLMAALERLARERGFVRLQLETGLRQPEAIALYRDLGYRDIAPYGYYKDSAETVCLTKDL